MAASSFSCTHSRVPDPAAMSERVAPRRFRPIFLRQHHFCVRDGRLAAIQATMETHPAIQEQGFNLVEEAAPAPIGLTGEQIAELRVGMHIARVHDHEGFWSGSQLMERPGHGWEVRFRDVVQTYPVPLPSPIPVFGHRFALDIAIGGRSLAWGEEWPLDVVVGVKSAVAEDFDATDGQLLGVEVCRDEWVLARGGENSDVVVIEITAPMLPDL